MSKCILCGAENSKFLEIERYGYRFSTVRCTSCKFVSIEPRPDHHAVKNLYTMDYFQGEGFDKSINYIDSLEKIEQNKSIFHSRLEMIERFSTKGVMLDAGCGVGDFLLTARERGWKTEGVEISDDAAKVCRTNGITVYTDTLENLKMTDRYDCIIMVEVIEHLMNPSEAVANCYKALKSKGIIVIQTGNVESVYARIAGKNWFYFLYGHLNYFSPTTLGKLLTDNSFTIEKMFYGDEIALSAKMQSYWIGKKKSSPVNWMKFLHMVLFHTTRGLHIGNFSAGAMVFYARKM